MPPYGAKLDNRRDANMSDTQATEASLRAILGLIDKCTTREELRECVRRVVGADDQWPGIMLPLD